MMFDELPFDEKKLADELHDLGYKITTLAKSRRGEYWADIGRLQGDLSDVYRIPNTSVLRRKDGTYEIILSCHHYDARKDEVLVGIHATHIGNGQFRFECKGNEFAVKLEPGGDRDAFIRDATREMLQFTDDRRKNWR